MSLEKYKINLAKEEISRRIDDEEDEQVQCESGSISRKEGIEKRILMQAVHLWIINPKTKKVVMQRRSKNKENDPYMIDVSCSGHVRANEIPEQSILREAFEEMELPPDILFPNLQKLIKSEIDFTKYNRKGKYIVHEYLAFLEKELDFYKINEEVEFLFEEDYEKVKESIRRQDSEMRIPKSEETEKVLACIDEAILEKGHSEEKEKE